MSSSLTYPHSLHQLPWRLSLLTPLSSLSSLSYSFLCNFLFPYYAGHHANSFALPGGRWGRCHRPRVQNGKTRGVEPGWGYKEPGDKEGVPRNDSASSTYEVRIFVDGCTWAKSERERSTRQINENSTCSIPKLVRPMHIYTTH
jgi:hypothetical protein